MGSDRSTRGKGDWALSQPRPLTLLIACGIVLATALLIVTGLVAGYLRQQTLKSSEAGLSQLDAVLVEAGNRSLLARRSGAERYSEPHSPAPTCRDRMRSPARSARPRSVAHLDRQVEAAPQIAGIALIGADGAVISRTGGWPSGETNVAARDYFVALQDQCGTRILDRRADRA